MSLSGGEVKASQERIITGLKEKYPQTSKSYLVCTDTFGSIATAFPGGEGVSAHMYLTTLSLPPPPLSPPPPPPPLSLSLSLSLALSLSLP
ncbi:MAG: hypothetical protein MJE68_18125, partial [Proteobacteria bacterium]|nr:hypothetical protein [Pseudomonadota bacterium]